MLILMPMLTSDVSCYTLFEYGASSAYYGYHIDYSAAATLLTTCYIAGTIVRGEGFPIPRLLRLETLVQLDIQVLTHIT